MAQGYNRRPCRGLNSQLTHLESDALPTAPDCQEYSGICRKQQFCFNLNKWRCELPSITVYLDFICFCKLFFLIFFAVAESDSSDSSSDEEDSNVEGKADASESSSSSGDSSDSNSDGESEGELKLLGNIKSKGGDRSANWKAERKERKQKKKKEIDPAQKEANIKQEKVWFLIFRRCCLKEKLSLAL